MHHVCGKSNSGTYSVQNGNHPTSLPLASCKGQVEVGQFLVDRGADTNTPESGAELHAAPNASCHHANTLTRVQMQSTEPITSCIGPWPREGYWIVAFSVANWQELSVQCPPI